MKSLRTLGLGAAIALSAGMRGVQAVLPSNEPEVPVPAHIAAAPRRQRLRRYKAWMSAVENEENRLRNRRERARRRALRDPDTVERQRILARMTNGQLTRWQRAGRPQDLDEMRKFARLPHYKAIRGLLLLEAQLEVMAGVYD